MNVPTRRFKRRIVLLGLSITFVVLFVSSFSPSSRSILKYMFGLGIDEEKSLFYSPAIAIPMTNSFNERIYRENATLMSLVRNSELKGMLKSIADVERRFNDNYHYDWNFLNEEPFTVEFINAVREKVSGKAIFTIIPKKYWSIPDWIDGPKLKDSMQRLAKEKVMYADKISYRHMCRFNSGFFYKLNVLQKYKYYWRVEPNVRFKCDIPYDPFLLMKKESKTYGFNMAMTEDEKAINGLWETTLNFFQNNKQLINADHSLDFISHEWVDDQITADYEDEFSRPYNTCHFWSNFEIADMDFFRSQAYESYFQELDKTGGFFYDRWGDAPVHTMAVSFLLKPEDLHYFDNTGYYHKPNQQCPASLEMRSKLNCQCNYKKDFSFHKWSCVPRYFKAFGIPFPDMTQIHS